MCLPHEASSAVRFDLTLPCAHENRPKALGDGSQAITRIEAKRDDQEGDYDEALSKLGTGCSLDDYSKKREAARTALGLP
jgi:hypothetical protein